MKILHLISSGGMYGAEAVILTLSQGLIAQGDESEIALFENLPHPNLDLRSAAARRSIPTHTIVCHGQLDLSMPGRIRDLARSVSADVVHAHGYKADLYTWAALRNAAIPVISTCHNWIETTGPLRAYGTLDRRVLRSFAAVVAVSQEVQERLLSAGVDPDRVTRIPNGIDTQPFLAHAPVSRAQSSGVSLLIGFVGRLSPEKGPDLFLQAAARVLQQYPLTRFQIIGDGPDRSSLQQLAQTLNIQDQVAFLGRKDNMPGVYATLDLLVSSSRQEGLPMSLLEAMASSLPIVATSVGEVPSLIHDQSTGLLVPPDDVAALAAAIGSLLADATFCQQLGTNARLLVEKDFSAAQMTQRYKQVYAQTLTSSGQRQTSQ